MNNSNNKTAVTLTSYMRDILKVTSDLTGQTQSEIIRMAITLYCQSVINKGIIEVDNSMVKK
jgi:predicted DNA-binding protein